MNTTQPKLPPNPEAGAQQQAATPTPAESGRVERLPDGKPYPTPPAEGELIDLAGYAQAWAARLDEGTPEERLLRRVAYVLRQRQSPPHEGEVDALIKILSRIARMLDFMPDGPPNGLIIHRAIELLRQLTPPAEGEVGKLVAKLRRLRNPLGTADPTFYRAAALIEQQAAELAILRQQAAPVPVSERLPEPSVKVLAHYFNNLGKGRTICAIWVPAKTRSDSYGDDAEYDEASDTFYWPEGWYETIENWDDLGYVKVDEGEVIYWQPLPQWPSHALPLPSAEDTNG